MSRTSLNGIRTYENRWMRIAELGMDENGNLLLCKEIKEDFINPTESWKREEALVEKLKAVSLLEGVPDPKMGKNKRAYLLPQGTSLLALIEEDHLEMPERLKVAGELIRITLELHGKNHLFCDLSPALFWYDQIEEVIYLVDTIMTVEATRLSEQYSTVIGIEPDMYCMSPEHTLHANANLDFRSNYYSLGVVLYALFTGAFPIQSYDRVAVIHKHLSQLPANPRLVNKDLGAGMAAFIMRLLAKDSNERYQSAVGLLHDFKICSHLQATGDLDTVPDLGTRDFPSSFSVPKSVFFRKESLHTLLDLTKTLGDGQKSLALIRTEQGGGIAYLLDAFFEELNYDRYYVGAGKYTPQDSIPFKGLKDVTSEILHQVLMEDSGVLRELKATLREQVGSLSGVLIDFDSDFNYLFEERSEVRELIGNAAINRFIYAYTEFLRILELQGKSIIIALEHFELADLGTAMLITQLLKSSVMRGIYLVVGVSGEAELHNTNCRQFLEAARRGFDTEDPPETENLNLGNFNQDEVRNILETLKIEPREEFGEVLYQKTRGNVTFMNQFFQEMSSHHHIRANTERKVWEVNMHEVQNFDVSDNLNEFLGNRIAQLSGDEQQVLKAAASIGQEVEVFQLLKILPFDTDVSGELIDSLREKGFFTPVEYHNARLIKMKFSHSGFIPVLRGAMTAGELQGYKLALLNTLVASMDEHEIDSRIYEVVGHLVPLQASTCLPYKEYLKKAAYRAKRETAFSVASTYFTKLCEIDRIDEQVSQQTVYENAFQAAICALSAQDYKGYKALFARLEEVAESEQQRYRIFLIRAIESMQREDYAVTLDILEEGLNEMGISFRQTINKARIIGMFMGNLWRTRNWNEDIITKLPMDRDPVRGIAQRLINIAAPAVYFLKPALTSRINYIGLRNTARYGLSSQTPYHLVGFGFQVNSFSNSVKKAHHICRLAFRLMKEGITSKEEAVPVHFLYASFVKHTEYPLEECIASLEENYKRAREQGNISVAHYSLGMNRWYLLFNGTPIPRLQELLNASHKLSLEDNQGLIDDFHKLIKTLLVELSRGHFSETPLTEKGLPLNWEAFRSNRYEENRILLANLIMVRMIVEAGNNRVIEDKQLIRTLLDTVKEGGNGPFNAILHIFYSCYHFYKAGKKSIRAVSEKEVKKFVQVLKVRAETAPSNYRVKYLLLKALQAEYHGQVSEARTFYTEANMWVAEYTNLWDAALSKELFGVFLRQQGQRRASASLLAESVRLYRQWGALSIANRIFAEYPEIAPQMESGTKDSKAPFQEQIGVANRISSLLQWSIDVFHQDHLNAQVGILLDKISEEAIAEKAVFVIRNELSHTIYAVKEHGKPMEVINATADDSDLPLTVFRLVERRKKHLLIGEAHNNPQYRSDTYISANHVRSILCIPFVRANEVKSFIYLENNHLDDVFESVNLDLITWIFSQIAMSIDNAILTDLLEEKLEHRSLQIKQERDKANELITNILPRKVAEELKTYGRVKAHNFENVSVLFTDFKDFSIFSETLDAEQIIHELDDCFKAFDRIVERYGLEKIKTIGDSYMCAGGIPEPVERHEYQITRAGLEMLDYIEKSNQDREQRGVAPLSLRVGIHTGPLIAGVVGSKKYAYDIWGPTVNIASRMESSGKPGRLNVSGSVYLKIRDKFKCTYRGKISAKNIGEVDMYFVDGPL